MPSLRWLQARSGPEREHGALLRPLYEPNARFGTRMSQCRRARRRGRQPGAHQPHRPDLERRYAAVEFIVAEAEWKSRFRKPRASRSPEDMVYVRTGYAETELRTKMKALGAIWRPKLKFRELPWGVVRGLELEGRMVEESRNGMGR